MLQKGSDPDTAPQSALIIQFSHHKRIREKGRLSGCMKLAQEEVCLNNSNNSSVILLGTKTSLVNGYTS